MMEMYEKNGELQQPWETKLTCILKSFDGASSVPPETTARCFFFASSRIGPETSAFLSMVYQYLVFQ
jgi:hypothetical protein